MKKLPALIIVFVIIFISTSSIDSYAEKVVLARNRQGEIKDVSYAIEDGFEIVRLTAEGYTDYSCMELKDPLRIVLDIKNVSAPGKQAKVQAGGKLVERVRYARYASDTGRVVLDVKGDYEFTIESADSGFVIYVSEKQASQKPAGARTVKFGANYGIEYIPDGENEAISMSFGRYDGYRVTRKTDPERLILTIPDAGFISSDKQLTVNGKQIESVSYKKSGKRDAVITIGLNGQYQYSFSEDENRLVMALSQPAYRDIAYHNNGDRVYFEIKNSKLTEGDKNLSQLYTAAYDDENKQYIVSFPSGQASLGEGILDINDPYLRFFEVRENSEEGITSLIFKETARNSYLIYTRKSGATAITVLRPAAGAQKIVVIDPGHGGSATGTIYGELEEKNLNLDIAKRLNALLGEKGVETYMMREDDCDVDNYERAYIANMLNAKLYLSIHINAMNNKRFGGTMTLYCPSDGSGFTGNDFAKIIQKNLVGKLKTVDRNIRSRPDLIVLRETYMPAALAEIAFLTNSIDRENLKKEAFRQKAAQALCESVMQALKKVK